MKKLLPIAFITLLLSSTACQDDDVMTDLNTDNGTITVTAIGASITSTTESRTYYDPEYKSDGSMGNLKVTWEAGDHFELYEATGDDYTTPTGSSLGTFTIKDEYDGKNYGIFIADKSIELDNTKHYLAVWEMEIPDDCKYVEYTVSSKKKYLVQYGNDNTDHLKYGDKMIAKISYQDNTINTSDGTTSASFQALEHGNVTHYIHFYHPEHFVMRVVMNQFLYDIPEGALLRVYGLKGHEVQQSAQVRLQCAGSSKSATKGSLIDVAEATSGLRYPLGYASSSSSIRTTFTAYIICDENILKDVDEILFSLCDDNNDTTSDHSKSSQDRYNWQLKMPGDFDLKHGEFWKFDLTQYTCRPAFRMSAAGTVCWGVTDLGADDVIDCGYFYQALNPKPVAKSIAEVVTADLTVDSYYNNFFTPKTGYTMTQYRELANELWSLVRDENNADTNFAALPDDYTLAGIFQKSESVFTAQSNYYSFNAIRDYDIVYQNRGGMWFMPTATNITELIDNGNVETTKLTGLGGIKVTYKNHSIYFRTGNVYQQSTTGKNTVLQGTSAFIYSRTFATNSGKTSDKDRAATYYYPNEENRYSLTNFQFFKACTVRPVLNVEALDAAAE